MKSVHHRRHGRACANIFDLQPLEVRRFLTTASVSSGQLTINGTSNGETITVNQFNSTSVSVTGVSGSFSRGSFTRIFVNAGGGNDTILISGNLGSVQTTISGGNGNDFITGGAGPDRISGDAGFDTANYSARTSAVRVDLDGNADDGGSGGAEGDNVMTDEVIGGSGNDLITGVGGAEFLAGGAGGDTLSGSAGNDELVGSTGIDRLLGQSGDDAIYAKNSDADTVNGGTNSDGTPDFDLAEVDGIDVSGIGALLARNPALAAALDVAELEAHVLDPSYGPDGEQPDLDEGLNSGPDFNWSAITAATVDSQGRVIVVGYDTRVAGEFFHSDFVAIRYDVNGLWDQSFGGDGEVNVNFSGEGLMEDRAFGVTTDADDNIIIVGSSRDTFAADDEDFAVCRLDDTGALDTSFGTRRYDIVLDDSGLGGGMDDEARDVVVQADGQIVVVGTRRDGGNEVTAVIRVDGADGDLDTTFNGYGMNHLDIGFNQGSAVALQTLAGDEGAQRVVVGATLQGNFLVARFTADGELDATFGGNGVLAVDVNDGSADILNDVAVNADNEIVAVGQTFFPIGLSEPTPIFNASGVLLSASADGGTFDLHVADYVSSFNAATFDGDGNVVVVGTDGDVFTNETGDFVVTRFTATFDLDETFNGGAPVRTDFTPAEDSEWFDVALGVGMDPDGKIVVGGYSDTCGDGCIQTSVARFGSSGFEVEEFLDYDDVQNDSGGNRSAAATFYLKSTHLDDQGRAFVELTNNNDVVTLELVQDEDGNDQVAMTVGDLVLYYDTTTTSITIDGKNGHDVIVANNDVSVPLFIFGGNGSDRLAGGSANDQINGGAGNDTVTGNDGHDVLVGEAGLDSMSGNAGNDILIGGSASDSLDGGADDDILIGGTTAYDGDPVALGALSAEWSSGGSYEDRVDNLRNGGGLNGTSVLRVGSGATVFDDNARDTYTGGSERDWFFRKNTGGNNTRDQLLDDVLGEEIDTF